MVFNVMHLCLERISIKGNNLCCMQIARHVVVVKLYFLSKI